MRLVAARCRLASTRRAATAALGLVGLRLRGTATASPSRAAKRSIASRRLASWLRWVWATTRRRPAESSREARRRRARALASGGNDGEPARSKRSSTRESVVLTPWPPGPEARLARNSSSSTGIATSGVIRITWATASSPAVPRPGRPRDVGQVAGAVDERHVRERLGEVAELAAEVRVELLGQQPDVVAQRQQALEDRGCL